MRSLNGLSNISLTIIAIAAAKVINHFYPYAKIHVEEGIHENYHGTYPAYSVIAKSGYRWIDVFRDDHLTHWVTGGEYDTFIVSDDTTGQSWSFEDEFFELLWEELGLN